MSFHAEVVSWPLGAMPKDTLTCDKITAMHMAYCFILVLSHVYLACCYTVVDIVMHYGALFSFLFLP